MERQLEVDVHAHWNDNPPVYRIYINEELFIERTFGWTPYQFFITENLCCNLEKGIHKLRLENLSETSRFEIAALRLDGISIGKNLMQVKNNNIEWKILIDVVEVNTRTCQEKPLHDDISRPLPLATKFIQPIYPLKEKKYQTNLALVQRMRELNNRLPKNK